MKKEEDRHDIETVEIPTMKTTDIDPFDVVAIRLLQLMKEIEEEVS